jgi:spore coat polysaccharide biosynthesis protein SpsF
MGSVRLPGKSLMDLAGGPLVGRILERLKRIDVVNCIVLATSDQKEDNVLETLAHDYGVDCFRGSEDDLVDRYYRCAAHFEADVILRFPGDNPCPEPSEHVRLIDYHLSSGNDFSSNICNFSSNGYPDGIGVEAFNFQVLEEIWKRERDPRKREHISLNFLDYASEKYPNLSKFSIGTIRCPKNISRPEIVLDVNTQEEYQFMKQLYEDIYSENPNFSIHDIIQWYDRVV